MKKETSNFLDFDAVTFQYFPSQVWKPEPLGSLTLRQFLNSIKNPKDSTLEVFKKIEKAAAEGDLKTKDYLKQNFLYYTNPSIITNGLGRKYEDIVQLNPIMTCEFDKIDYAEELKQFLFERIDSCIAAWLSPSRRGLKLLIRIPAPKSIEEYKEYYCGMAYHLEKYNNFDGVNFNIALPLFISYDENILIREDAKEWTIRGGKMNAFKVLEGEFEVPHDINEEDKEEVKKIIERCFNKIVDSGHPAVVSYSSLLGGYVASQYISYDEAVDFAFELIQNNEYLSKGVKGYQKTSAEMIRRGMNSPVLLKRHENGT